MQMCIGYTKYIHCLIYVYKLYNINISNLVIYNIIHKYTL